MFSCSQQLTSVFADHRCKKANKCNTKAGPHVNSLKSEMKLFPHDSCSHSVPNYRVVVVKDAQYSWQRFIKADFG